MTAITSRPAHHWSAPLEIGSMWHRRRLAEHLAGVEAATARAALAVEMNDKTALDSAMQQLVREARLAEMALIKADHLDVWTNGGRR